MTKSKKSQRRNASRKSEIAHNLVVPWELVEDSRFAYGTPITWATDFKALVPSVPLGVAPKTQNGWDTMSAVFDQFRVDSLTFILNPLDPSDDIVFKYSVDNDGGAADSLNNINDRAGLKVETIRKNNPKPIRIHVSKPGIVKNDSVQIHKWYDIAGISNTDFWYGAQSAIIVRDSSVSTQSFLLTTMMKLSFKGRR